MWYNTLMNEAQFQTFITKWMKYRFTTETGIENVLYDCKVVDGLSLAQSKVYPHQVQALSNAGNDTGCHYKIPDVGRAKKPSDGFLIRNAYGCLIILYNRKEPTKKFFGIFDMKNWDKKSITPDRCYALFKFRSKNEIPLKIK